MPTDLSKIEIDEGDVTERQEQLLVWRDFLRFLHTGYANRCGTDDNPWEADDMKKNMSLRFATATIEENVKLLQCGELEHYSLGEPKDLYKCSDIIDVRD